jgi:ATP-binding cassette subfamily B protein
MLQKFPYEKQYDKMDCGPACLKIISKYYGKYYNLQLFRERAGITKDGVNFLGLSYAAESVGFKTLSVDCNVTDLRDKIQLPCIVHFNNNHFIVVYKVTDKHVYVSDPASGLSKIPVKRFIENWYNENDKGYALLLEPSADFKLREADNRIERSKTFEKLFHYFIPYKAAFINLFVVLIIITALQVSLPFISRAVIDVGIQTNDLDFIHILLFGNIILVVCMALGGTVRDWIVMHIASRVNTALISDYLSKIMKLPVSFFETKLFGDIIQRAQDNERIRSFIMDNSLNFVFSILTFAIFSIIMLVFSKIVFFIFITGITIYVFWILSFIKLRKKLDWEYFDLNSRNQSFWFETVSGITDIKVNNYEQKKRWKWEALQAKLFHVNKKVMFITNTQSSGAQLIDGIKSLSIVFYCAQAVINGEMTFGVMISIQYMIGMLNAPITQFIQFVTQFQYAKISFNRTNEIYQLEEEEDVTKADNFVMPDNKSLVIKGVSFQYSPVSSMILKNINLVIPEGKTTAIVGGSGSGKTTLLKLILRLYKPSFGEILLGEMNTQNINLKHYRSKFGVVLQDGKIFSDSILNNIVLDDTNIDYEKVKEVLKTSNLTSEIESLPLGYQTVVGENGKGLSGGQKQRLLIARALYKNPDYLLLDEATNSLDTINEKKIVEALNNSFTGKTVIVIAHRLSTIQNADQIIVLKDGFIIEAGNHKTLVARNGYYSSLVNSQSTAIAAL